LGGGVVEKRQESAVDRERRGAGLGLFFSLGGVFLLHSVWVVFPNIPQYILAENIAERKEMNVCNEKNFRKYSLIYSCSSIDGLAAHVLGKSWLMAHSS
jgi:hypothetical protein